MAKTTIQSEIRKYNPALGLDRYFLSLKRRRFLIKLLGWLLVISLILSAVLSFLLYAGDGILSFIPSLDATDNLLLKLPLINGISSLLLGLFLLLGMFSAFFNTFYYRGLKSILGQKTKGMGITYEVAEILSRAKGNLTSSFVVSQYGRMVLQRSGIEPKLYFDSPPSSGQKLSRESLKIPEEGFMTLSDLSLYIYEKDKNFQQFLFQNGITKETYLGSVEWVAREIHQKKYKERWWGRDNLGRIPGIGTDWSYGGAYSLEKFSHTPEKLSNLSSSVIPPYINQKVDEIETILARRKEANALLVGEQGVGKMDVLAALSRRIKEGRVLPPLSSTYIKIFDAEAFIAINGEKAQFEKSFIKLLNEIQKAGNVIFAVNNMASFIASSAFIGADVVEILDPYLAGSGMHFIALADDSSFHQVLEKKSHLMQRFDIVKIDSASTGSTIRVLEDTATDFERSQKILFTYPAIEAIALSADRYITYGIMPDKAIDLLNEIVPLVEKSGSRTVTKRIVLEHVGKKTSIPIGEIKEEEREKLKNLEGELHNHIIGQEEAVKTISNAMRRARTGIQNPNRPLGSFLFLGPTGVGKTHTAKTLAKVFFGDENKMARLDMSEYNTNDALDKLIGSFSTGSTGVLSSMLRDQPYGVLLLDEFEKTTTEVANLFLQILDEGFFSDMRGRKVSARNTIIIATSNAGSDIIWDMSRSGKNPAEAKDQIIDAIIRGGIYKPELINRFDGVVVFHPLSEENVASIARIMLKTLHDRIRDRGYELSLNDALVSFLVKEGYSVEFGARPMRRVLQDRVEKAVADKIIDGGLKKGGTIELTEADLQA